MKVRDPTAKNETRRFGGAAYASCPNTAVSGASDRMLTRQRKHNDRILCLTEYSDQSDFIRRVQVPWVYFTSPRVLVSRRRTFVNVLKNTKFIHNEKIIYLFILKCSSHI